FARKIAGALLYLYSHRQKFQVKEKLIQKELIYFSWIGLGRLNPNLNLEKLKSKLLLRCFEPFKPLY
ncbi:MAG: hypothetical protein JW798_15460, partial [Prolixibacteraceae bacterium]|nr:hypothetical protein [Prolixibacteraceae bacterium]